jgi:hypothetical protein
MHGYDAARVIEADARVFVTVEAHDPTLATVVHDIRSYAPKDMRIGGFCADHPADQKTKTEPCPNPW